MKNGFSLVEVITVFLVLLAAAFFIIPQTFDNTNQAKNVLKWKDSYKNVQYVFSILKIEQDNSLAKDEAKLFDAAENNDIREVMLLEKLMPFFRFEKKIDYRLYKNYYLNKKRVKTEDEYSFKKLYLTQSGKIVGLKWLSKKCTEKQVCGRILVDTNGIFLPNTWGKDIFGLNIYKTKITPFGNEVGPEKAKEDCKKGSGLFCSYYYVIGGNFD